MAALWQWLVSHEQGTLVVRCCVVGAPPEQRRRGGQVPLGRLLEPDCLGIRARDVTFRHTPKIRIQCQFPVPFWLGGGQNLAVRRCRCRENMARIRQSSHGQILALASIKARFCPWISDTSPEGCSLFARKRDGGTASLDASTLSS